MRVGHYILTNFNLPRRFGESSRRAPDEAWMTRRLEIFRRYCAPSIRAQHDQRFRWLVRFDPTTPPDYLERVRRLSDRLEVIFEPFRPRIHRAMSRRFDFLIMTRLDNDDVLHRDFTRFVRSRLDGSQKIVDVEGYQLDVRDGRRDLYVGKYIETHRYPTPFISLLTPARDDFPVVTAHPHHDMGKHFPVERSSRKYFLQVIHGANASNRIVGTRVSEPVDLANFGLEPLESKATRP